MMILYLYLYKYINRLMQKFDIIEQLANWKKQLTQDRQEIIKQAKQQTLNQVYKLLQHQPPKHQSPKHQSPNPEYPPLQQLTHQLQQTQQQLQNLEQHIYEKTINMINHQFLKFQQRNKQLQYQMIKTIRAIKNDVKYQDRLLEFVPDARLQEIQSVNKYMYQSISYINMESPYIEQFQIKGNNRITCQGNGTDHQLLSNVPISVKNTSTLKIIKSVGSYIGFGIVDEKYIADKTSFSRKQCIYYFIGNNGIVENGKWECHDRPNGKTIQNAEVQMKVEGDKIIWRMGEKTKQYRSLQLLDESIKWVPFIIMVKVGDQVIWS